MKFNKTSVALIASFVLVVIIGGATYLILQGENTAKSVDEYFSQNLSEEQYKSLENLTVGVEKPTQFQNQVATSEIDNLDEIIKILESQDMPPELRDEIEKAIDLLEELQLSIASTDDVNDYLNTINPDSFITEVELEDSVDFDSVIAEYKVYRQAISESTPPAGFEEYRILLLADIDSYIEFFEQTSIYDSFIVEEPDFDSLTPQELETYILQLEQDVNSLTNTSFPEPQLTVEKIEEIFANYLGNDLEEIEAQINDLFDNIED